MERIIMEIAIELAGLIICVFYRRLTPWMWLTIGSMSGALMLSSYRSFIALAWERGYSSTYYMHWYFSEFYLAACWALFFVGLAKVLAAHRQVRDDQKALVLRAEATEIDSSDERIQTEPVSVSR